jgi:putative ABC transport system permease protein
VSTVLLPLLKTFSWQELRHHPWRNLAAVVAVMLGVALAFAVQLINASALDEFAQAVRSVSGQADLVLRSGQAQFDEAVFARVANHPQVAQASPVLEINTYALAANGKRLPVRVLGVDALVVAQMAPTLLPRPAAGADRFVLFAPDSVFLNAAAQALLAGESNSNLSNTLRVQSGLDLLSLRARGTVQAGGAALAVMDIGAAQELFGKTGLLSRIDIRLQPGVPREAFAQSLQSAPEWPAGLRLAQPEDDTARLGNLSRAYRVNLSVLALVALFTGAFLVFSVLALSVAKRAQQFALLGVLGLTGRQRMHLVMWESAVLGLVGSALGIALGTALAAAALRLLGGDLGSGFFAGAAPALQWDGLAALLYGILGLGAALVGGWWPARQAADLPPAQTLKGLGAFDADGSPRWLGIVLIAAGALLTRAPAIFGIPVAAYLAVACWLVGGIMALPWLITLLLDKVSPWVQHRALPLLAVERARRVRQSAGVAVSGVVASLSLAVALTVMVASFRDSVMHWLDAVLPADIYVRTVISASAGETAFFQPGFVVAARGVAGVARVATQRVRLLQLQSDKPAVALMARAIDEPARDLPLVGSALPVPAGQIGIYVSEAMLDLHGAVPGQPFEALNQALALANPAQSATFFVAGVWRDYARQGGSIAMRVQEYERLTGDLRVNDLALWLQPGADAAQIQAQIRALADAGTPGAARLIEFASSGEIRAVSLRIFDRSFAVTYWLQAVAIAIGLFGVAASFSAQVLARRKEFGLLVHLGLTRAQVLTVVAGEGLAWTAVGAVAGLLLGLAISVVLVKVVNPQSFHWTMEMVLPWLRLGLLCGAVVVAGTVTAWLAGRAAAGRDAVLAVKEDW